MDGVIDAIETELRLWSSYAKIDKFGTVFFGGGTPSYVPPNSISRLLHTASFSFGISDGAEITLEANPDDINLCAVSAWRDAGVNRLSLGVQSFNDHMLAALSRRHSAEGALEAIQLARRRGFSNISIDLMYGLPHQTIEDWNATLGTAIGLCLPHLSLYCLQIEPNTPMALSVKLDETPKPDDDLAADMYELAIDRLASAGYEHYEISNWCLPNMQSRHNLGYWHNSAYLGIGPGAHSNLDDARFWNVKTPRAYTEAIRRSAWVSEINSTHIAEGRLAIEGVETTSIEMQMSETMMLGLRLREGVSIAEFEHRFNADPLDVWACEIESLLALRLIKHDSGRLRLTRRGRLLGNEVFQKFV